MVTHGLGAVGARRGPPPPGKGAPPGRPEGRTAARRTLGVTDEVASFEALSPAMLVALGSKGVKTLDDLADLAGDELIEIVGTEGMDEELANEIIMAARAHWFEDGASEAGAPAAAAGGAAGESGEAGHA